MALISGLERELKSFSGRPRTAIPAKYTVGTLAGRRVLELKTYGTSHREFPDQPSQTMVFEKEAAQQLWEALGREFNFR